jgi:hypothetical protein
MELFKAHRQWSSRPSDERFASLEELYQVTKDYAEKARESTTTWDKLRVEAVNDDVQLVGRTGIPAQFTHWAFGQLCSRVEAPASYLRELPATLAAQNLNYGLANKVDTSRAQLMFHQNNGDLVLRACTSDMYSRIWNYEVAERLLRLQEIGWEPARPDKRFDGGNPEECLICNGTGKQFEYNNPRVYISGSACPKCKGTGKALAAVYASDHDMFAFVRNRTAVIREHGNPDGLQRGVIVENSEVGASALKGTRFLYRTMCGNHIIWGATRVMDISVRHVGNVRGRFYNFSYELKRYSEESASDEEAKISSAKAKVIAQTKEQVLDTLFGQKRIDVPRRTLEASYDAVIPDQDGSPNTVWGIVQGMTRHSQTIPYADQRTKLDRAAGKVLEIAF